MVDNQFPPGDPKSYFAERNYPREALIPPRTAGILEPEEIVARRKYHRELRDNFGKEPTAREFRWYQRRSKLSQSKQKRRRWKLWRRRERN